MYLTVFILVALMLIYWASTLLKLVTGADLPAQWNLDEPLTQSVPRGMPAPIPKLSILIPARNEVDNIESSVCSALSIEYPGEHEVIVVDDRSTDGTSAILDRLRSQHKRLIVIQGNEPAPGWLGKPHALHRAQQHATGDILVFVDADVRLTKTGVHRTLMRMQDSGAQMCSVLGKLETGSFFEHIIQPRLGAILAGGNPLDAVNDPEDERVLANGQFLCFTRTAYDEIGGHQSIRDSVLDDVDIATRAQKLGINYVLFYGQTVFSCRMYKGLAEIWSGWSKNLFPGMKYSIVGTLILTTLMFLWTCMPFLGLAYCLLYVDVSLSEPLLPMLIAVVTLILATDLFGHRARGYRWGYFWTFPLGMGLICLLFLTSAFKITFGFGATWKGRTVETRAQRSDRLRRQESEHNS
jgi:glycosyltransferase involved in cell wall biosynthesis